MIAKTRKASKRIAALLAATMVVTASPIDASAAKAPAWKAKKTSMTVGQKYTFKVKNIPSKGKVTFSSSKKTVATVSAKGVVKAKKKGKTVIKAVVKNKKKKKVKTLKVTLNVKAKKPTATATPAVTATPIVTPTTTATVAPNVEPTATAPTAVPSTVAPTGVVDPTAQPTADPSEGADKVVDKVSITAVGRTWVEISFPDAIDSSATADNFKITTDATDIAATVNAAHWSTGYKTVKLNVTGLQYGLKYTVSFDGLKSAGVNYPVDSLTFNASTIEEAWELQIVPERESLTANGKDNMKVTFNLIDSATGVVDPNADEIVLDLSTTYGNFQTKEVTLKDGTGIAVLRSDFFPVTTKSKIHVEVKETSNEYKSLKGVVSADRIITMEAENYSASGEAVLTSVESGQADRVTLTFDKDVNVASFVEYNKSKKEYKTEWVEASTIGWDAKTTDPNVKVNKDGKVIYERQLFIDNKKSSVNFKIMKKDGSEQYPIVGMNTIEGASNKLELVLHEAKPLDDNDEYVIVYDNKNAGMNSKSIDFKLTDVKDPKFVSATSEGLKRVVLKFSEPIPALKNSEQVVNDIYNVDGNAYKFSGAEYGTFNPATLEDTRNNVILTLGKNEKGVQQYFQEREGVDDKDSYNYQIAITKVVDFAGTNCSDKENVIDANQDNTFKVTGDTRKPEATVTVESPEQFRVSFTCPVTFEMKDGETLSNIFQKAFKVDNGAKVGYVDVFVDGKYKVSGEKIFGDKTVVPTLSASETQFFNVTPICNGKEVASTEAADEFVVELTQDWTKVYKTSSPTSGKNYYNDSFKFKFAEQTIINDDNGWKNDAIDLDLNYVAKEDKVASPLNKSDDVSPAILDIQETSDNRYFTVVMNEPIQYHNTDEVETKATNTYSETNTKLNPVEVTVQGTDPAGKDYTFKGIFRGYDKDSDKIKKDTMLKLEVVDSKGRTLQDLVDEGYGNDWKIALRYTYDDVLNATDTIHKVFTVEPSEENVFEIANVEGVTGTVNDIITVTFTKGVATNSAALKPASWTINGTKLESAPIKYVEASGTPVTGYRSITISLPAGTLTAGKSAILGVDQTIKSINDIVLTGEHEIKFTPVNGTTSSTPTK